jgi:hypothetical protein
MPQTLSRVLSDEDSVTETEAQSPTGLYPGPIWADDSPAVAAALDSDEADPPSATGVYPGPVWADEATPQADAQPLGVAAVDASPAFAKESGYRDEVDQDPVPEAAPQLQAPVALDNQAIYEIIREVALADSGADVYSAVTTAGVEAGFGVCIGLVHFDQASGRVGSVLRLMQARDPATLADIFGPAVDELLAVTTASTREERLRPVGGEALWSDAWCERFRRAGAAPPFQAAQNEEAIEHQFRPALRVALDLGFDTARALAMVYDRVVTRGVGGGLRWIVETAGPLRTAAQRAAALELLGSPDLAAFQATAGISSMDGRIGLETYAALVAALRRQGKVAVPSADDLQSRLIAGASGVGRERLLRLRDSDKLSDTVYSSS